MTVAVLIRYLEIGFIPVILASFALLLLQVRRFIIPRYEDSGVTQMAYFRHEAFQILSGSFWKAGLYSIHLVLVAVVPLKFLVRSAAFRDLTTADDILRRFSHGELVSALAVWIGFLLGIVMAATATLLRALA